MALIFDHTLRAYYDDTILVVPRRSNRTVVVGTPLLTTSVLTTPVLSTPIVHTPVLTTPVLTLGTVPTASLELHEPVRRTIRTRPIFGRASSHPLWTGP